METRDGVRHAACPLCEAMCGLRITVEDGAVTGVRGDPEDPFSRGHVCPKAAALPDLHTDPDRLRHPVRRTPTGWERVSWDDALADIAARVHTLQSEHGMSAVATYAGNPTVHNTGLMLYGPPLLRYLKSKARFSATSVDQLPHMVAADQMFGHRLLLPVPDVDHTELFVVFGANPLVSNGSLMSAPGMDRRLRELRARGGRLVVFDPRRTETARKADAHHFVRPGTDGLVLMALIEAVFREGPVLGHLAERLEGVDALRELCQPFTAEAVEGPTGVPAAAIRALAESLRTTPRAVVYGRMGVCTQAFGTLNAWLIYALNALTGHLDSRGGAMFAQPALDLVYPPGTRRLRASFDHRRSRVRDLPALGGELPVATLADEIQTPGEGQIRGLICLAGNPVLSTPNGRKLDEALSELDLLVCIDPMITETARHAHYILPPTSALSRPHYDIAFHLLAVRNTTRWSDPVLQDDGDVWPDWRIVSRLHRQLARQRGAGLALRTRLAATEALGPSGLVDLALRLGPRGGLRGLSLSKLRAQPHGIDLGPLEPCLTERMSPDRGHITLAPEAFVGDVQRLRTHLDAPVPKLVLIGRRQLRSNNSWMHNSRRLTKGKDRCTVLVHPTDAEERGIVDGDAVELTSRVGAVRATAQLSDTMMPGVVSLPHGWGHDRPGTRLGVAGERPGVSANDLTDEQVVDAISGNAVLNGVPVRLCAV